MPRPKKPGAPAPKSRSRKGCWPCKARKVKCDETNSSNPEGPCLACQRLKQECDFRVRLNWEGRGKKEQPGMINFSSNKLSVATGSGPASASAPSASPPPPVAAVASQSVFRASPPRMQSTAPTLQPQSQTQATFNSPAPSYMQQPYPPRPTSTEIDPLLTGFQIPMANMFPDNIFGTTRTSSQYTQSYERYREDGPSTPKSGLPPLVSRLRHMQDSDDTFSATESGAPSPAASTYSNRSATLPRMDSPVSTPPNYAGGDDGDGFESASYTRSSKRRRYGFGQEAGPSYDRSMPPPGSNTFSSYQNELPPIGYNTGFGNSTSNPSTPRSSHSEDAFKNNYGKSSSYAAQDPPDLRRLSVHSLLSGPPGISYQDRNSTPRSNPEAHQDIYSDLITYGLDRGIKDRDIPKNDDMNALTGSSPIAKRAHLALVMSPSDQLEFGFGMEENNLAFEMGGYYNGHVVVALPKILHPLPPKLRQNPMNILYFHHFLNHTAKCLLPHNCASNPFRMILPLMAVQDENLMNLFLAYSAFHRSRLLRQPQPTTRIALWVQDVFANLRKALDDPSQIITNAILAAAIMLASLEIISPNAFGVTVPWQSHLDTARQMILLRGGPKGMRTEGRSDRVSSFLWSWFAYLDVLGSLSGGKNSPSSSWVLDYHVEADTDYEIDCVLGFTSKCIRILAKIAALAQVCDSERIRPAGEDATEWTPSEEMTNRAAQLDAELVESRLAPSTPCTHMQSTGEAAYQWDSVEMGATNEAFHWAGHVHLHRRILGKPSPHPEVQNAVREIFGALYKVRRGSNAEGCLLFPMFTAGCDTQDARQRADILERMKGAERLGMTQVHRARTLMERVWETGLPWETLVAGYIPSDALAWFSKAAKLFIQAHEANVQPDLTQ